MAIETFQASSPSVSSSKRPRVSRETINGTWQALTVAFLQSVEGVIFPLINLVPIVFSMIAKDRYDVSVAISATVAMEAVALIGTVLYYGPKTWLASMHHLRRKTGRKIMWGVLLGTITGNVCFKVAVLFGGSSYGTILSSLYPVFTIMGTVLIMRQRYDQRTYWFAALNAAVAALFIILPAVVTSGNEQFSFAKQGVGMLLSLLAALFWSIESLFIRQGMRDTKIQEKHILNIRMTIALVMNLVFLLPLSGLISPNVHNAYPVFATVLSHYEIWLICIALGLALIVMRSVHTAALGNIGSAKTAVLDANYIVITPCLAYMIAAIMGIYATDQDSQLYTVWKELNAGLIPWWGFLLIFGIVATLLPTLYFASKTNTGRKSLSEHVG